MTRSLRALLPFVLLLVPAPLLAQPTTTRVSLDSGGSEGNQDSSSPDISANGRFVAFQSSATNLVAGDTNGVADVFVTDRKTGKTTRVSVSSGGGQATGYSLSCEISDNGRFVVFESNAADLVTGDTNGFIDVFLHDRKKNKTVRISRGTGGAEPDADCRSPAISGNGRFVLFDSSATNLVAGDSNGTLDVFRFDTKTKKMLRLSVHTSGAESNGLATKPQSSKNGRYVVFHSDATNLIDTDGNGNWDVFLHDCRKRRTTRVASGLFGAEPDDDNTFASISGNGRFIGFASRATNLVPGISNTQRNAYLFDRRSGRLTRISKGLGVVDGDSSLNGLSSTGRYAVFHSDSTNLVGTDANASRDVFLWDSKTGTNALISVGPGMVQGDDDSGGAVVAGKKARFIVYQSDATNLVAGDSNAREDIFITRR